MKRIIKIGILFCVVLFICSLSVIADDLSNYPSLFIENGKFEGVLVIGDEAAPEDAYSALEIATQLQYSVGQQEEIVISSETTEIDEGYKFEEVGEYLNAGIESIADIKDKIGKEELPDILADETYEESEGETANKKTYYQEISFFDDDTSGVVGLYQPDDRNADAYLLFEDDVTTYAYTLKFDEAVEYTNTSSGNNTPADDLENTVIKIQGDEYTIIDVEYDSTANYIINKLTLFGGKAVVWLKQGGIVTQNIGDKKYSIEVTDVNDMETMCGVSVNGELFWINVGEIAKINDIEIGVIDAVAAHEQLQDADVCKISIGASKIVLEDGKEVVKDGSEIDNSNVGFIGSAGNWEGFNITWRPDEDVYLATGEALDDPIFDKFKIVFGGSDRDDDMIVAQTVGSNKAEFTFPNVDGVSVTIPFTFNGSRVAIGTDDDELMLVDSENCTGTTSVDECEGYYIWSISSGGEVHVLEIDNIDTENDQIDIEDVTYGKAYEDRSYTDGTSSSIDLGIYSPINITIDETNKYIKINKAAETDAETEKGATITFDSTSVNSTVYLLEEEDDDTSDLVTKFSFVFIPDATDDEIDIATPSDDLVAYRTVINAMTAGAYAGLGIPGGMPESFYAQLMASGALGTELQTLYNLRSILNYAGWVDIEEGNDDTIISGGLYGTIIAYDNKDEHRVQILYPDEEGTANVFIAPKKSEIILPGDTITSVSLEKIGSGLAKLASEVEGKEDELNMIIVGGPCINKAAAKIMGFNRSLCGKESGIREDKAIIKLYDNGDKKALLLAGYEAKDTMAATRVIANYEDYSLHGMEMEITNTKLSEIQIEKLSYSLESVAGTEFGAAEEGNITEAVKEAEEAASMPGITGAAVAGLCPGSNPATADVTIKAKKMGISKEGVTHIKVSVSGTEGEITAGGDTAFKSQAGITWMKYTFHVLKDSCNGAEVAKTTLTWEDGVKDATGTFTLPSEGCYCLKMTSDDTVLSSGSLEVISNNGLFNLEFST